MITQSYRVRAVASAGGALGLLAAFAWFSMDMPKKRPGVTHVEDSKGNILRDLAVSSGVDKLKNPQGISDHFSANVGLLHCWVEISEGRDYEKLTMVWRRNATEINSQTVDVLPTAKRRAVSLQGIDPSQTGAWSCEVQSEDGVSLGTAKFTVK